jgi:hypothetical protein
MIRHMEKVRIFIWTVPSIPVSGERTSNTALVLKPGQTGLVMKAITSMVKSMELELLSGPIILCI